MACTNGVRAHVACTAFVHRLAGYMASWPPAQAGDATHRCDANSPVHHFQSAIHAVNGDVSTARMSCRARCMLKATPYTAEERLHA